MIKTYSKKNVLQKKKELDPFDNLSSERTSNSNSPFTADLSRINEKSVFLRNSSTPLNNACFNKSRANNYFSENISYNLNPSFEENSNYNSNSFLNDCLIESFNEDYIHTFDFDSPFSINVNNQKTKKISKTIIFNNACFNNSRANSNDDFSENIPYNLNSSFEENYNSNSFLNDCLIESFNEDYINTFNFDTSFFSNVDCQEPKTSKQVILLSPEVKKTIYNEFITTYESANKKINKQVNNKNLEDSIKSNSNSLRRSNYSSSPEKLQCSNELKSLKKSEDQEESILELKNKIKNVTLRDKNDNSSLNKTSSKKHSMYHSSGDGPERTFSSQLLNRKTLCRRQSHRVLPLKQKSINEITFFRTLYTNEILEETSENSTLEETSIININEKTILQKCDDQDKFKKSVLHKCNQTEPLDFEIFYNKRFAGKCKKIGEGVFGEVFSFNDSFRNTVLKIIPIEGDKLVNNEPQKTFENIFSEITITQELSNLRNGIEFKTSCFVELIGTYCLKGKYPEELISLWNNYDEEKVSENDSPEMFEEDQLYIVLELDNGGIDLEAFEFKNSRESYSIFKQLTFALAVAECSLEFEHRDLHWGNLLISRTNNIENFILFDKTYSIPTNGVKLTIIDFTLSRMTFENCCLYNDLALDSELFEATGDYQFEIYRKMQSKIRNKWETYEPFNNILWLHYILDKMINHVRYNKTKSKSKIHQSCLILITSHFNKILNSESAANYVLNELNS